MEDGAYLLFSALIEEHDLLRLDLVYRTSAVFEQAYDELVVNEENFLHLTLLVHFRFVRKGFLRSGEALECRRRSH